MKLGQFCLLLIAFSAIAQASHQSEITIVTESNSPHVTAVTQSKCEQIDEGASVVITYRGTSDYKVVTQVGENPTYQYLAFGYTTRKGTSVSKRRR